MKGYLGLLIVLVLLLIPSICLANGGRLYNASNATVASFSSDGTIRNASNASIGRTDSGVKKEWAAAYFFFNYFK